MATVRRSQDDHRHCTTVGIVGGGPSGCLLAIRLLEDSDFIGRVLIFNSGPKVARGVAYSTTEENHLLNVPAGRMSLSDCRPLDFVEWLTTKNWSHDNLYKSFVPRHLFGDYLYESLEHVLVQSEKNGKNSGTVIPTEIVSIEKQENQYQLLAHDQRVYNCDIVVLATGLNAPGGLGLVEKEVSSPYWVNPWNPVWTSKVRERDEVLIIGTGLTMIDSVLSLMSVNHRGPINVISRRGLCPSIHSRVQDPPIELNIHEIPKTIRGIVRFLRLKSDELMRNGKSWIPLVDGLRPITQTLWQLLNEKEKNRFLRHVRPYWEIHRHRVPFDTWSTLEQALKAGRLQVYSGKVLQLKCLDESAEVITYSGKPQTSESPKVLRSFYPRWIVDATGSGMYDPKSLSPLLNSMVKKGLAQIDLQGLGIKVDRNSMICDAADQKQNRIFALGNLTRGQFWEITSVPDIRKQVDGVAREIVHMAGTSVQSDNHPSRDYRPPAKGDPSESVHRNSPVY